MEASGPLRSISIPPKTSSKYTFLRSSRRGGATTSTWANISIDLATKTGFWGSFRQKQRPALYGIIAQVASFSGGIRNTSHIPPLKDATCAQSI